MRRLPLAASAALLLAGAAPAAAADPQTADRLDMVRTIEVIARKSSGDATPTILNAGVLDAIRQYQLAVSSSADRAYGV